LLSDELFVTSTIRKFIYCTKHNKQNVTKRHLFTYVLMQIQEIINFAKVATARYSIKTA
jgi:hypothetical protein